MFIKVTAVKVSSVHNPNAPVAVDEVEIVNSDHVVRMRRGKHGGARLFFTSGEPLDVGETVDALALAFA